MTEPFAEQVTVAPERPVRTLPGWLGLFLSLITVGLAIWILLLGLRSEGAGGSAPLIVIGIVLLIVGLILWHGIFVVQPNQAKVLIFFGKYRGSVKSEGWYFANPLCTRRAVSLRVHNFTSPQLKVNDAVGNPIEIAAVVVWRVVDTARALFAVEDYKTFVEVQAETAIRHLASQYPYDDEDGGRSLRGSSDEVAVTLQKELQERLNMAGIAVLEARLSHLAYSPEIAGAMLQRQQATAIIAARQKIVEGAVSMVEMALDMLSDHQTVKLSPEQKAALVSNLLVVLTSDRNTQPIVPVGGQS